MTAPTLQAGEVLVGFSRPKKWNPLSALIMWFTKSPCSHTWLLYLDTDLRLPMVMEAHITFQLLPLEVFEAQNRVVAYARPGCDLNAGLRKAALWLGSFYDVPGLLGMIPVMLKRLWRGAKARMRNPMNSPKSVFCSEAVTFVLRESDYKPASGLSASSTSPKDLYNLFASQGQLEVLP